jgi:hypothetical protein
MHEVRLRWLIPADYGALRSSKSKHRGGISECLALFPARDDLPRENENGQRMEEERDHGRRYPMASLIVVISER